MGEKRLHELENQQARLAADMDAERNKVAELQVCSWSYLGLSLGKKERILRTG
jgi:hypothetical protein